jgi:pimeloyl-ACP methyl ester carboxylesterase
VHSGYNEAYAEIREPFCEKLDELLDRHSNIQEIFVTGHSLGGAAALDIKARRSTRSRGRHVC